MKFGAIVTALLFEVGKFLIGMYLGSSTAVTSLGAAGALLALLFWVYYSSQIFLFGAAITKARAEASGRSGVTQTLKPAPASTAVASSRRREEATSSVLSLAVFLLARTIALMIVERWQRRAHAQRSGRVRKAAP